ncbi:MAG TPA: hypothetical protein VH593_15940 [Ktedonobacteraceae bacterium]
MKKRSVWQYWLLLGIFGALAAILFLLNALTEPPEWAHNFSQAVAEALVVAIVVALVVEPRLLSHFGEELASRTFWTSFYSRAPEKYREAIKELASADQFAIAAHWAVAFDWLDGDKTILKLSAESIIHYENRGGKSHPFRVRAFIYDSPFPKLAAEISFYSIICQGTELYIDPIQEGLVKVERGRDGRLMMLPADESTSAHLEVLPGLRYTIVRKAFTYVSAIGHFPLVMTAPTLSFTIGLSGNALPDLYLSIVNPSSGTVGGQNSDIGNKLRDMSPISVSGVCLTGQAVLLSWAKQEAQDPQQSA